jgi:hypothetical protein
MSGKTASSRERQAASGWRLLYCSRNKALRWLWLAANERAWWTRESGTEFPAGSRVLFTRPYGVKPIVIGLPYVRRGFA